MPWLPVTSDLRHFGTGTEVSGHYRSAEESSCRNVLGLKCPVSTVTSAAYVAAQDL